MTYSGRAPNLENLDLTPVPDFDEYFHVRESSGYDDAPDAHEVMIPFETARGCWYGMKNHCTFCGLNRSGMDFRSKSAPQVLEHLQTLSRRYGTLHFNAIDNILAPEYVTVHEFYNASLDRYFRTQANRDVGRKTNGVFVLVDQRAPNDVLGF